MSDLAGIIKKRFSTIQGCRQNWENHWEEVAKYVIPRKDNVYGNYDPGSKKNQHLFNSEAIKSNDELADALASIMTNPQTKWFELGDFQAIDVPDEEARWLDAATRIMLQTFAKSNFYTAIHETYADLPSFATGAFFTHDDDEDDVRFEANPIYEWYLGLDAKNRPRIAYRKYCLSVRQLVEKYPDLLNNETIKSEYQNTPDKKHDVILAIEPIDSIKDLMSEKNETWNYGMVRTLCNMGLVLEESGFRTFPGAFPRFSIANNEIYGRGPAMKALPDIKTLNAMDGVNLQSAQLSMAPPLQTTENALLRPVKYKPFGMTFRKPGSDPIEPLVTGARVDIGIDLIQRKEEKIREHFYIPQLRMVQNDRMTATEIMQRRDEQFRSLGSVLSRLSKELLEPVIDRVFDILYIKGRFPPLPESMKGKPIKISYTSLIARAQQQAESENFTRAIQATGPVIEMDPAVMDNIDGDTVLRKNLERNGVDRSFMRRPSEVTQMREQRQQAEQEARQAELANQGSQAVKNLSEAERNG